MLRRHGRAAAVLDDPHGARDGSARLSRGGGGDAGLELAWAFQRWDRFRPALEAGEVDAIWCGSAITEERRVISYSRPYAAIDEAVLVRADRRRDLAGLRGRRVGAIAASTNMGWPRRSAPPSWLPSTARPTTCSPR